MVARNKARKGPPKPRTEIERQQALPAGGPTTPEFFRFIMNPHGAFDAKIAVKEGRLMVGPADDDGVVLDRKVSRECAARVLLDQALLSGVEGLAARLSAIVELIDLRLQELEADR